MDSPAQHGEFRSNDGNRSFGEHRISLGVRVGRDLRKGAGRPRSPFGQILLRYPFGDVGCVPLPNDSSQRAARWEFNSNTKSECKC